jgi:hypothetical protein
MSATGPSCGWLCHFRRRLDAQRLPPHRDLRSINNDDASRCVDVFLRPEGTIGSRNIGEMPKTVAVGFRLGPILPRIFADEGAALCAATEAVTWLREMLGG